MTDLTRKVRVRNRASGTVAYVIPALRITRIWDKTGDIINISIDELIELKTISGGQALLDEYLAVEDDEAVKLLYDYELPPEYNYGEAEIDYLLHAGTNEQLFDALDYAPIGVLEMIKSMAIKERPDTTAKVEAINKKFGIDLLLIIKNAEVDIDNIDYTDTITPRRSAPVELSSEQKKSTSKYKVVDKK